jgi:hypothetical protein
MGLQQGEGGAGLCGATQERGRSEEGLKRTWKGSRGEQGRGLSRAIKTVREGRVREGMEKVERQNEWQSKAGQDQPSIIGLGWWLADMHCL